MLKHSYKSLKHSVKHRSCEKVSGLDNYLKAVSLQSGKFLGVAGLGSVAGVGALAINPVAVLPLFGAGVVASFYSAYKMGVVEEDEKLFYGNVMHAGMGCLMAPVVLMSKAVLVPAAVVTGVVVGGSVMAGCYMPQGVMAPYGRPLYVGLAGLIAVGIGGFWIPALHTVNVYGGVALFTGLTMYDTQKTISDFNAGVIDEVGHAANFSLNTLNIFIRMLEIMSRNK